MPLQSCRIKDAFKTPGTGRCESQGGVRGSVGGRGMGGDVWERWRWRGGLGGGVGLLQMSSVGGEAADSSSGILQTPVSPPG